jgi:hypothetical protein
MIKESGRQAGPDFLFYFLLKTALHFTYNL